MITVKDIEKLAALARLKIADGEKETLTKEIDAILGYVEQVQKFSESVGERPVPAHRNVFRADEKPHESGAFTEDILANAPQRDGEYLKVKKILGSQSA